MKNNRIFIILIIALVASTVELQGCSSAVSSLVGSMNKGWQCIVAMGQMQSALQWQSDRLCPTDKVLSDCFNSSATEFRAYYGGGCHCTQDTYGLAELWIKPMLPEQNYRGLKQTFLNKICSTQFYNGFVASLGGSLYESTLGACPDSGQARINLLDGAPQGKPEIVPDPPRATEDVEGVQLPQSWIDSGMTEDTKASRERNISDGISFKNSDFNADYDKTNMQEIQSSVGHRQQLWLGFLALGSCMLMLL